MYVKPNPIHGRDKSHNHTHSNWQLTRMVYVWVYSSNHQRLPQSSAFPTEGHPWHTHSVSTRQTRSEQVSSAAVPRRAGPPQPAPLGWCWAVLLREPRTGAQRQRPASPTARGHRPAGPLSAWTHTLEVYTQESSFCARAKCHVTKQQKETKRSKIWSKLSNSRATSKKGPNVNWKPAFDG